MMGHLPSCATYFLAILAILMSLPKPSTALPLQDKYIENCKELAKYGIPQMCPVSNSTFDWHCEAAELNCTGDTQFHCAQLADTEPGNVTYIRACAKPVFCAPGEEPYLKDTHGTYAIQCMPCRNKDSYNPSELLSAWYTHCPEEKVNKCTVENHKKDCGEERGWLAWDQNTMSDGTCRCDSRLGYRPVDINDAPAKYVSEICFKRYIACVPFTCGPGMEPSLGYGCIPICREGYSRTDLSDTCRNRLDPTETPMLSTRASEKTATLEKEPPHLETTSIEDPPVTTPSDTAQDLAFPISISLAGAFSIAVAFLIVKYRAELLKKCRPSTCYACKQSNLDKKKVRFQQDKASSESEHFLSSEGNESETSCLESCDVITCGTSSEDVNTVTPDKEKVCNSCRSKAVKKIKNNFYFGTVLNSYKGTNNITLDQEVTTTHLMKDKQHDLSAVFSGVKEQLQSAKKHDLGYEDSDTCMDLTDDDKHEDKNVSDDKFEDIRSLSSNKPDIVLMLLNKLVQLLNVPFQEACSTPWSLLTNVDYDAVYNSLECLATQLGTRLIDLVTFPQAPFLQPFCQPVLEARNVPDGYVAYQTSGRNNSCLYQAISILLCGDESLQHRLRLCSALDALKNLSVYVRQFELKFSQEGDTEAIVKRVQQVFGCYGIELDAYLRESCPDWRCQLRVLLFKVLIETCEANKDSSQLHVALLSNAISSEIVEHFQDGQDPDPCSSLQLKTITKKGEPPKQLNILWCRFSCNSLSMNHIVPLFGSRSLIKG